MSFTELTIERICVSPLNVRQNLEDCVDTAWLEDSIAATGLIYPLVVHPLPDGLFGALDGGRRYRAISRLIAAKRLPADWPVICVVRKDLTDAEMTELSLTAALQPRELRPWEIDAAIVRAHEQGDTVEDIVERIGQPERWVRQRLRLGRLAPEIFAAYAAGDLPVELARAYAATEDHALQLAAWNHFAEAEKWNHREAHIRAFLKIGDREEQRLLAFVGAEVYRAAGGRFELDLFADGPDDRGRVVDPALLHELAENKRALIRQELRRRTARSDLAFAASPPASAGGTTDWSLALDGITATEAVPAPIDLPSDEVVAVIEIGHEGDWTASFWWASKAALRRARGQPDAPDEAAPRAFGRRIEAGEAFADQSAYAQVARAAVKDEHGVTADGLQIVRSMRRALLRGLIVSDASNGGTLGRDFLVWSQLRQELGGTRWQSTGTRGLAGEWSGHSDSEPSGLAEPFLAEMPAQTLWLQALERIGREPFMTIEDPAEAFAAYLDALEPVKAIASAVLAGLALVRSANVPGWRVPAQDVLAARAGGSDEALREGWEPDEAFLALLPKLKRLELAQPFVGQAQTLAWSKLKDKEISAAVAGALRDAPGWIHPLLSFNVPSPSKVPEREAAQ
jgi:ParB family chromosome partitioning protein